MDEIYYEKTLNRIIQGRLRLRLGDLVLFIYEPTKDIIEESFDVYEDTRKKAYFSGVYIQDEVIQLLVENDLWTPFDDRRWPMFAVLGLCNRLDGAVPCRRTKYGAARCPNSPIL